MLTFEFFDPVTNKTKRAQFLQLALYDPLDGEIVHREGKFANTRSERAHLKATIREYNRMYGDRSDILVNLCVVAWQPMAAAID